MSEPDAAMISCSGPDEIMSAYNAIIVTLPWPLRDSLCEAMRCYLIEHDVEGVFERFNNRSVAKILAEFRPPPGWIPRVPRRMWAETRHVALNGTADDVRTSACPRCGGSLTIRFDADSPQPDGSTAGCLFIKCAPCAAGTTIDDLKAPPPWIERLGPQSETHPPGV